MAPWEQGGLTPANEHPRQRLSPPGAPLPAHVEQAPSRPRRSKKQSADVGRLPLPVPLFVERSRSRPHSSTAVPESAADVYQLEHDGVSLAATEAQVDVAALTPPPTATGVSTRYTHRSSRLLWSSTTTGVARGKRKVSHRAPLRWQMANHGPPRKGSASAGSPHGRRKEAYWMLRWYESWRPNVETLPKNSRNSRNSAGRSLHDKLRQEQGGRGETVCVGYHSLLFYLCPCQVPVEAAGLERRRASGDQTSSLMVLLVTSQENDARDTWSRHGCSVAYWPLTARSNLARSTLHQGMLHLW